jgi:adenylate kinase family enzyme
VTIKPRVFVLGLPKSGKSTLCKILSEKIGVVHLKMNHIINQFIS